MGLGINLKVWWLGTIVALLETDFYITMEDFKNNFAMLTVIILYKLEAESHVKTELNWSKLIRLSLYFHFKYRTGSERPRCNNNYNVPGKQPVHQKS